MSFADEDDGEDDAPLVVMPDGVEDDEIGYPPLTFREARLLLQRRHGKRPFPAVPEDVSPRVYAILWLLDRLSTMNSTVSPRCTSNASTCAFTSVNCATQ